MNKPIDRIVVLVTILSFLGTVVSWATTNLIALVVTFIVLGLSMFYILMRFLMRRVHLQTHAEYRPLEKFLMDADKVDIIGINLAQIVSGHQGFIEERAKSGCNFRFIITDPALMDSFPTSLQTKRNTKNTCDLLGIIMKKSSNVELKLLQFVPVYGLLIKQFSTKSHGVAQVEIYSQTEIFRQEVLTQNQPHLVLSQDGNKYWYSYFWQEFEDAWKYATKVSS